MLTLEEFISAKKAEDGIEEKNPAQLTKNKKICIRYVEEYFDLIANKKEQECTLSLIIHSDDSLLEDVLDPKIHNALKRFFTLYKFTEIKTIKDFNNRFRIDLVQRKLVKRSSRSSYKVRHIGELSLVKLHRIVTNTKPEKS